MPPGLRRLVGTSHPPTAGHLHACLPAIVDSDRRTAAAEPDLASHPVALPATTLDIHLECVLAARIPIQPTASRNLTDETDSPSGSPESGERSRSSRGRGDDTMSAARRKVNRVSAAERVSQVKLIAALYEAGQSINDIVRALQMPYATVHSRLRTAGVTMRPVGDTRKPVTAVNLLPGADDAEDRRAAQASATGSGSSRLAYRRTRVSLFAHHPRACAADTSPPRRAQGPRAHMAMVR